MPQDYAVASVLLVMSLGLETRTVWDAVRRPDGGGARGQCEPGTRAAVGVAGRASAGAEPCPRA